MPKIYFDHSATTPLDQWVFEAMKPYFTKDYGNASSMHSFGQIAAKAIDQSRLSIAKFLNCLPEEVIFTSGATEADNIALQGIVKASKINNPHIVTTQIEHPAILEVCRDLEKQGVGVTYVPVTKKGIVKVNDIKRAIKPNTILISVMYVNNEVGTIQPISEIGKLVDQLNTKRKNRIYFHTDAVQAVNYCEMNVNKLGVDLLSISGHKIYGPKGVGVLYIKKNIKLKPIEYGGHHELGIRPGTYNVVGIVGLGRAIELVKVGKKNNQKIKKLRDYLIKEISKKIPNTKVNGDIKNRVASNVNFSFKNAEGESVMLMLDMEGFAVSTGSACSSGSLEPSHVLTSMQIPNDLAHGSLRITLGKQNTKNEVDRLIRILPKIIQRLRQMSPIK
ncbi:IscS subfamily cysteine desulfurase [Patescibacteria group bacterium]|nr:IscS subfamily cysteine desulfurase [Patescibacteria group bacterium]